MVFYSNLLLPAIDPPREYKEIIKPGGKQVVISIVTQKLPQSPNFIYSAFILDHSEPILRWISKPGRSDLLDAYNTWASKKGRR